MLKASDIMTQDVATIRGSATIAEATSLMQSRGWRALIVERWHDQDSYGIITETDIVYKVAAFGKDPHAVRVYQIMTKPCISINPDLGVEYVARLFADTGLRIAPVIQKTLLGIIAESDIMRKLDVLAHQQQSTLTNRLSEAIASAHMTCDAAGIGSTDCREAWQVVDTLQSEVAFQRAEPLDKTAFEAFRESYPDALDLDLYEQWCSG